VNDDIDVHPEKELFPRYSTEAGRQIDFNDEQPENADPSIRVSFDSGSNVNDDIDLHLQKEVSPRDLTEAGRQIDLKDEQEESARCSI
jgi:hypothetical protein